MNNSELSTIPILSGLPPEALQTIQARAQRHTLTDGVQVITEGDAAGSMFLLAQGAVRVVRGGTSEHLTTIVAPTVFGEMALVAETKRLATIITQGPCTLIEVTRELILEVSQHFPNVGQKILSFYRDRLLRNVLASTPLFEPISHEYKEEMVAAFVSQNLVPGQLIIEEGQPGIGLYVLLRGECEVHQHRDGQGDLVGELGEGDIFGEISLVLFDQPCVATVRAKTEGVALFLNREVFQTTIMSNADVRASLMRLALGRIRDNSTRAAAPA